jgi:outer membrane immunogenic protein
MNKLATAAALLPVTVTWHQALAADVAPATAESWTGLHIGAGAGYDWSRVEVQGNYDYYGDCTDYACSADLGSDKDFASAIALIDAGADYQVLDKLVVGIGADFSVGSASRSSNDLDGVEIGSSIGNTWSLYSRFGFALDERFLAYGLFGWTAADVEQTLSIDSLGWQETVSNSDWLNGLTLGGGLEAMLAENVSLKVEYRYTRFDASSADLSRTIEAPIVFDENVSLSSDVTLQSARAVLSYRF